MPRRSVVLALVLGLAAPASADASTAVPVGLGYAANVAVDGAGTAYIAWNGGESPSTLRFCRLPRGATVCDVTTTIAGAGDSDSRPFVSVAGGTVRLLQYRHGAASGVYRYISPNGGAIFDAGTVVGFPPFTDAVVGPNDSLSGITSAFSEGTVFQNVPLAGANPGPASAPSCRAPTTIRTTARSGCSTPPRRSPCSAAAPRSRSSGATTAAARSTTWRTGRRAVDIGYADTPSLAGGPAGLFMLSGLADDSITVRRFSGATFGSAATVLARGEDVNSDLVQDPAGRLHAVVSRGDLDGFHLVHATSDDGAAWRSGTSLVQADGAIGEPRAAVAGDHVGVAVWSATIITGPRAGTKEIRVAAIGPEAPVDPPAGDRRRAAPRRRPPRPAPRPARRPGSPRGRSRRPRRSGSRTAACASRSRACCGVRPG